MGISETIPSTLPHSFPRIIMTHSITLVIFSSVISCLLLLSTVSAEPLEDQLPDTTGLFFGKRASHPNMNNLLFGRRSSYENLGDRELTMKQAQRICENVQKSCVAYGIL